MKQRDIFRESVFERDNHKCVVCGEPALDAHHIIAFSQKAIIRIIIMINGEI